MTVADTQREERFDALFRQYLPHMVAYCGWRSASEADAQDAISEVFLVAWRRLEEIPAGAEARLWLYGTARRVLANQARAGRRRVQLFARVAAAQDQLVAPTASSAVTETVRLALALLKPADREVLLLAEWEGLSPSEIGAVMGCPTVTARGRLFRARRRFRQVYEALPERRSARDDSAADPSSSTQGVMQCS